MKKILGIVLALMLAAAVCACSSEMDATRSAAAPETESSAVPAEASTEASADETAAGESAGEDHAIAEDEPMRIALITMDQMDVHWVKLEKAAREEAEKLKAEGNNIEYEWLAPMRKDSAAQIEQIETAINNGADAIIISVNDATACNHALQNALNKGIHLIYVDARASVPAEAAFATDNYEAGRIAGKELLSRLKEAGKTEGEIGIISAQAGVQSCIDRVDGFVSALEGTPYTMSAVQYSDGDASKAQELAATLIDAGVVAVFAANDGATTGAANAVKEANASGRDVLCVGFDNTSSNRSLVRDGALAAFMAQNPAVMGADSIDTAVALLKGEDLEETDVDTGVFTVTTANVDDFED